MLVIRSGEAASVDQIDDLSWLQTPFNLASFTKSGAKSVKFLTASVSDDLGDGDEPGKVITLVAKNNGLETIERNRFAIQGSPRRSGHPRHARCSRQRRNGSLAWPQT